MTVNAITPNMLILEARQEPEDKDYGSCLWARFSFNLDRYEMSITSDCGNYGYKWCETPNSESFLHLMTRCDKWYIMNKIYGHENIFDYDLTKKKMYENHNFEDEKEKLDEIFENIECQYIPENDDDFVRLFMDENDGTFDTEDAYYAIEHVFPANALKICEVFDEHIRPYIQKLLQENNTK